jgi:hypothetical protein
MAGAGGIDRDAATGGISGRGASGAGAGASEGLEVPSVPDVTGAGARGAAGEGEFDSGNRARERAGADVDPLSLVTVASSLSSNGAEPVDLDARRPESTAEVAESSGWNFSGRCSEAWALEREEAAGRVA